MQEILELLVCNATQKNIRIDNHFSEDTVVFADKNMISTVIRNLTPNAIKSTKTNGHIQFSAQPLENEVVFVGTDLV
jgi:signal transduction histidine kinase